MRNYRFLTSSRWVGLIIAAIIVIVTCVLLGRWQWHRYEYKKALVAQFDRAYHAEVIDMDAVVRAGVSVGADREWQPVKLDGSWASQQQVILRNRAVDGKNAYRVLAIYRARTDSGPIDVVVDRGWIPVTDTAPSPPPLQTGPIVGRLRPAEPADGREVSGNQVQTINPDQVLEVAQLTDTQVPVLHGFVQITDGDAGLSWYPTPKRDLGPHLSYAAQWWIFAGGTVIGVVILARREAQEQTGVRRPAKKRGLAESEEDALIEAQLGG
ncbi:MAG: SURF1 family protein [Bowdeniella nasicola]|nr:SURF1 family protein [Bowdeniella nasicola]